MNLQTASVVLAFATSFFLPLVSDLIHQRHWPDELRGVITTVLAVATALVQELIANPDHYSWTVAGLHAAVFWVVAYVARNQTWRTSDDPSAHTLSNKLHAFPRRLPPGGVQPGHEHHEDVAA